MVKIAPSILSADFANLGSEVKAIELAGADMIHLDVMDGHFVPSISYGEVVIKSIRKFTNLPFDVHLMVKNPDKFIELYAEAGANIITVHHESTLHLDLLIEQIKKAGVKVGLSLLPSTSPEVLEYVIEKLDMILVMTVNPGWGGQKFIQNQLAKISIISNKINKIGNKILLSVDGGINKETAKKCIEAGADTLVSGSFIFQGGNYAERIKELRGEN